MKTPFLIEYHIYYIKVTFFVGCKKLRHNKQRRHQQSRESFRCNFPVIGANILAKKTKHSRSFRFRWYIPTNMTLSFNINHKKSCFESQSKFLKSNLWLHLNTFFNSTYMFRMNSWSLKQTYSQSCYISTVLQNKC